MNGTALAVTVFFALTALVGGAGPALAGANEVQDHWRWQYQEAVETGALPMKDAAASAAETARQRDPGMSEGAPDFESDPRWKESGGE